MPTFPLTSHATVYCLTGLGWLVSTALPNHASVPPGRRISSLTPRCQMETVESSRRAGSGQEGGQWTEAACRPVWLVPWLFQVLLGSRVFLVN